MFFVKRKEDGFFFVQIQCFMFALKQTRAENVQKFSEK